MLATEGDNFGGVTKERYRKVSLRGGWGYGNGSKSQREGCV